MLLPGDTVTLCAGAEGAVWVQVFDVRDEAGCLGVWAGAGTDEGRM